MAPSSSETLTKVSDANKKYLSFSNCDAIGFIQEVVSQLSREQKAQLVKAVQDLNAQQEMYDKH